MRQTVADKILLLRRRRCFTRRLDRFLQSFGARVTDSLQMFHTIDTANFPQYFRARKFRIARENP